MNDYMLNNLADRLCSEGKVEEVNRMSLNELDQTLEELIEMGLLQVWQSRETRFRAIAPNSVCNDVESLDVPGGVKS